MKLTDIFPDHSAIYVIFLMFQLIECLFECRSNDLLFGCHLLVVDGWMFLCGDPNCQKFLAFNFVCVVSGNEFFISGHNDSTNLDNS